LPDFTPKQAPCQPAGQGGKQSQTSGKQQRHQNGQGQGDAAELGDAVVQPEYAKAHAAHAPEPTDSKCLFRVGVTPQSEQGSEGKQGDPALRERCKSQHLDCPRHKCHEPADTDHHTLTVRLLFPECPFWSQAAT